MAELTCTGCGHSNPADLVLCLECFSDLTHDESVATAPSVPPAEQTCEDCRAPLPAGSATCLTCRVDLEPAEIVSAAGGQSTRRETGGLVLDIDGRSLAVHGSMLLGRGDDSPAAQALARFDNVSRRHATLRTDGDGSAWVRDEFSANGTYVSDRRIPEGRDHPLHPGDTLRLASDVRIGVRWKGTR